MGRVILTLLSIAFLGCASESFAAGNGAGAGGAGHQRAINSGLPPGEPGPPGAVNNRHPTAVAAQAQPSGIGGSPRPETGMPSDR
jgi:hypothetical protein